MTPQAPFKRLILRAVLRNVSPMVIRVVALPDYLDLPNFDEVFRAILRWARPAAAPTASIGGPGSVAIGFAGNVCFESVGCVFAEWTADPAIARKHIGRANVESRLAVSESWERCQHVLRHPCARCAEYNVGMLGRIVHWPRAAGHARAVLESDDEELFAGLQRRDPHSIARLYDLYGSQVYRLILDRVECPCIADDLVVQTFLLAWNRAEQGSSQPTTLFLWLKSLATTCAADYVR
jgi:hypothetical protein